MRTAVMALAVILFSAGANAGKIANMKFSRMTSRDGLSCGVVNCVYKDSTGYLWIGTGFGLNRYDGTRVKTYYNDPNDSTSLAFNNVERIKCDYRGYLWLSQMTAYCTLNPVTGEFDQKPQQMFNDLGIDAWIYKVFIAKDKCYWFCAQDKGVYRYNPFNKKLQKFAIGDGKREVPKGMVSHVTQYGRSIVLTYQTGEIVAIDSEARWVQWVNTDVAEKMGHMQYDYRVDIDKYGNFWVRSNAGVMIHVLKSKRWYSSLPEFFKGEGFDCDYDYFVKDVSMDASGNHWIATDQGGVIIFNMKSKAVRRFVSDRHDETTLSDNTIQYIYCDDIHRMWLSSYRNGLNQWSEYNEGFYNIPLGDICTCIEETPDVIWAGSNDKGLFRYDMESGETKVFNTDNSPLKSNTIIASCKTADGSLWFGSYHGGLARYKNGQFKVYTTENSGLALDHVWSLCEDKAGHLWIGTLGAGVQRMNIYSDKFVTLNETTSKLSSKYVTSVSLDINGNIVVGTSNAYSTINTKTLEVTNVPRPADGVSKFSVTSSNQVICDSRGLIWMCTTAGLNVYDPLTGKNYILNKDKGMFGTVTYGVAEDSSGSVWVVTEFSVSKINVKINSGQCDFFIMNYDSRDGLQNGPYNQRSIFVGAGGKIYVGGNDGIDVISQSVNMERTVNPKVIFSDVSLYGEDVVIGKKYDGLTVLKQELNTCREISLKEGRSTVTIYLASSDVAIRARTKFTYWIEGLNHGWMSTDESLPVINLMGLKAGKYLVHVKALDDRGNECPDEAVLTIRVYGPVWRSWWAIAFYIIVALGVLVVIYRNRWRLLKALKDILGIEKRKARAAEIAEAKKKQLTPDQQLVRNVKLYLEQHLEEPDLSVISISRALRMSHVQLYSDITRIMKLTPSELIRDMRIERACMLLETTTLSSAEIAFSVGFPHLHAFTECFIQVKGMTPKNYRQQNQNK